MKFLLIIGNGFTIDFVRNCLPSSSGVDTINLFSKGANVPAPDGSKYGFLSAKHTPSLWALNARPHTNQIDSVRVFEDILSATQTYFSHGKKSTFLDDASLLRATHLRAYCEMQYYLRSLFIRYDLQHQNIANELEWAWGKLLEKLAKSSLINEIIVVSYNYDLWFERLLDKLNISYKYQNTSDSPAKFLIFKPHGSINFLPTSVSGSVVTAISDKLTNTIQYTLEEQDIPENVDIISENFSDHWTKYTLIPPSGDSGRLSAKWNGKLRENLLSKLQAWNEDDQAIICGLSYWHVDRNEIDEVLCKINPKSEVLMINPNPPSTLDATLTTLFRNYTCFLSSDILIEVANEL